MIQVGLRTLPERLMRHKPSQWLRYAAFRGLARYASSVFVDGESGSYILPAYDVGLSATTFMYRGFEEAKMVTVMNALAERGYVLEGLTLIDVGANVGVTSIPALTRFGFGATIALEPDPTNCRYLRANLALNGLLHRSRVLEVAATDEASHLSLERSPSNSGDHRIAVSQASGRYGEDGRESIAVDALPLRSLDLHGLPPVGLIWVDTQGHEGHVLRGMDGAFAEVPCVFEYWPYGLVRAGGIMQFHELLKSRFSTVLDIGAGQVYSPAGFLDSAYNYHGTSYTDILAVP